MSDGKSPQVESFQLKTNQVEVQVSLVGGESLRGRMFLKDYAEGHSGHETVADRLNDRPGFFPLGTTEPVNETLLVAKTQIRYVVVPPEARDERDALTRATAHEARVTVILDDGDTLAGTFLIDRPQARSRTLDHLNGQAQRFVLLTREADDCFINLRHVAYVRDAEG